MSKRIDYIQTALKEDAKNNPVRPLKEFTELCSLIGEQYDDKTTFTIKKEL